MAADDPPGPEGTDGRLTARPDEGLPNWAWRAVALFWGGYVIVYVGTGAFRALRSLLIVLLVSLFVSFAIEPAVNRMERWGVRRGVGTWLMFLGILLSTVGFSVAVGSALATQINDFVDEAPGYIDDIEEWVNETFNSEIDFDELQNEFVEGGTAQDLATRFADDLLNLGTRALGILFQVFTAALFIFYLVAEGPKLRRTICSFLEPDRQRQVLEIWDLAIEKTGGYIYSRSILALISALAHWAAFTIIDVPFPLPLALFVGVVSQFIPVIGTYIAGALPVLIATLDKPENGLWVLAVVLVYQQLENYVLAPRITAHTMELHVAVAFGSVIAGAALLGPVGALLALPFTATVQAFVTTYVSHFDVEEETLEASKSRRGRRLRPR